MWRPERAVTPWFFDIAKRLNVRRFAIDEAHCISHWGHDFRPEYRQLAKLREQFPEAQLACLHRHRHAARAGRYLRQLALRDPAVLVGSFDRPNLVYRVIPLVDRYGQTIEVVRRHANEAVIVYCIARKDAENVAGVLKANGIAAEAYHAGLEAEERRKVQEAFGAEQLNVVVATVAFGMGIDRSNVRCVLHTAMPKSIEHYQQESGRAGRDSLEAECVLLYSYADAARWEDLIRKSASEGEKPAESMAAQFQLLEQMQRLCKSQSCRHRALVEYFGQSFDRENCAACDVCLADVDGMEDGTVAAQKILSCVARVKEGFGVGYVVDVLAGADTEAIRRAGHHELSTYGLLRDVAKKQIQSMVYQLIDQGLLDRTPGDRPILKLNDASWAILKGEREVKLLKPKAEAPTKAKIDAESWEGVDRGLFDHLRTWRQTVAHERNVPPYVIFPDSTLRNLARARPTKEASLRQISGIGDKRLADFGAALLELIGQFCREQNVDSDQVDSATSPTEYVRPKSASAAKIEAYEMFRKGWSVDDVKHKLNRARSTVCGYLTEFIAEEKPASVSPWVADAVYRQVAEVVMSQGERRLTPIFERLDGRVPYDIIKLVMAHLEAIAE